ncbi:MAG: DNA repair protein RecO [bacterium]|nr:DNA repair protein RecO [bacterium]
MSLRQTEAIVIKSYSLSEADRIVVFFTREFGLIRGVAKGAKRLQSRFGSMLEPFSTVSLEYFQKEERELVSIQSVDLIKSRFATASDPDFLDTYSYIGDLLTDFSFPHDADEKLYRMLSACLSAAETERGLASVGLYFEVWLLRLSGFLPDWSSCEVCSRPTDPSREFLLVPGFHLQCPTCKRNYVIGTINSADMQTFNAVQRLSPTDFIQFSSTNQESVVVISSVMKRLIAQALGREVAGGAALR